MADTALDLLRVMLGPDAVFRDGQLEAIQAVVESRSRVLVVQRTGWGKSLVYFIASRMLRDRGGGPTILISPLLSLMRNQIAMSERIGIRALTMNSNNFDEWDAIESALRSDRCDVLLVSSERLANARFRNQTLPAIGRGIGLFVVDEAHCISDWGHDFRPDYRRIVSIIRGLPGTVPVLGTTATANDRVVADIEAQLGPGLVTHRGPLTRASLRLQAIRLGDQAERLAWLAEHLPELPGTGVVYCLTVADCERVSAWLATKGIFAPAYTGELDGETRIEREGQLLRNEVKALVATVALGMGFDKPDLGFVVHFQRPGSLVAYYQQIGRAGRALDTAAAVLLNGAEDDAIQDFFIRTAFPGADAMQRVLAAVESQVTPSIREIQREVNLPFGRIENALKLLDIEGAVTKEGSRYQRTFNAWQADTERSRRVTEQRYLELDRMKAFVQTDECLMEFVSRELDDPFAVRCGRCANCAGAQLPTVADAALTRDAIQFLRRGDRLIEPRKQWPVAPEGGKITIPGSLRLEVGRTLCFYADAGWGRMVADGKYRDGRFADELADAAAELVSTRWRPSPAPSWVTVVPSGAQPAPVRDFAERLAGRLGLPFFAALEKVAETAPQSTMQNSYQQWANIAGAIAVAPGCRPAGPVLLVDDVYDSRWTLTVCGTRLREAGVEAIIPFVLADASRYGGSE